jgi:alpha-1,6-mannosyltransferase
MDRVRRPNAVLVLLGAASAATYLAYVLLYPLPVHGQARRLFDVAELSQHEPSSAAVYAIGLVVLFGCYWLALDLVRRAHVPLKLIVLFGLLFALILVWLYPITATDLFQYVGRARLAVVYGVSPLAYPPQQYPRDPFIYLTKGWTDCLSPYGPAWENLASHVVSIAPNDPVHAALAFKALALISYGLCLALATWGAGRDAHAVLLFAWNPLLLLQGVGNGHNDLVMLLWMMLGFLLWKRARLWLPAVGALTMAALTKATAAPLLPLLAAAAMREQRGWERCRSIAIGAAVAAGVALIAFLPHWPPWEHVGGLLAEVDRSSLSTPSGVTEAIEWLLPLDVPQWLSNALTLTPLAAIYVWALARVWQARMDLAEAGLLVLFVYLLTRSSYRIWYPIWLVPLAALHLTRRTRLRTFLLCLTSELSVLTLTIGHAWLFDGRILPRLDWPAVVAITAPWQFGLPLLLPPLTPRTWTAARNWSILSHRGTEETETP